MTETRYARWEIFGPEKANLSNADEVIHLKEAVLDFIAEIKMLLDEGLDVTGAIYDLEEDDA